MGKRKLPDTGRREIQKRQKESRRTEALVPSNRSSSQRENNPTSYVKPLIPFKQGDAILFVGEGNFSFSASCIENHLEHAEGVIATCFDSATTVLDKYADASTHITTVLECCGQVRYEIDATKLSSTFKSQRFDVIIFCFPHVAAGIADEARNILSNQRMLQGFFREARAILSPHGHVAVALTKSRAYDLWNIKGLAKDVDLWLSRSGRFDNSAFPGYEHKRTAGEHLSKRLTFKDGTVGEKRDAKWYIFGKVQPAQGPRKDKTRSENDDDDDDDDT